jgi:hypothetical protein
MKKRLWSVSAFGFLLYFLGARPTNAQVSCSALVPARTCKIVSQLANDSLNRLLKSPVPMEVLNPDEYGKRKAMIKKQDDDTGRIMCDPSVPDPPCPITHKLQEFYNTWTDNVMFTRERDSQSSFPTKIIVSTDEFEHVLFDEKDCPCLDTKEKDGKDTVTNKRGVVVIKDGVSVLDGKLSIDKISETICFIEGYFNGLISMSLSNHEIWMKAH